MILYHRDGKLSTERTERTAAHKRGGRKSEKIGSHAQFLFGFEWNSSDIIKENTTAAVTPALAAVSGPVTA